MTGRHLQLPRISHRVRLEPNEKPVDGFGPGLWKCDKTETNVPQPSGLRCPFSVLACVFGWIQSIHPLNPTTHFP